MSGPSRMSRENSRFERGVAIIELVTNVTVFMFDLRYDTLGISVFGLSRRCIFHHPCTTFNGRDLEDFLVYLHDKLSEVG